MKEIVKIVIKKKQIQTSLPFSGPKYNQSWLEQEDRKLTRGMGWRGNRERETTTDYLVCLTILQYWEDFTVLSRSLSWFNKK